MLLQNDALVKELCSCATDENETIWSPSQVADYNYKVEETDSRPTLHVDKTVQNWIEDIKTLGGADAPDRVPDLGRCDSTIKPEREKELLHVKWPRKI